MSKKIYDEEEKDFRVAQGIWKNNNIIFQMIKEDIDGLITSRLLSLIKAHPDVFPRHTKTTVDCKE